RRCLPCVCLMTYACQSSRGSSPMGTPRWKETIMYSDSPQESRPASRHSLSGHDSAPDMGTAPVPLQASGGFSAFAPRVVTCQRRLDTLTDDELHALLRRIHALLLDRPATGADLSVQILRADEARLLALYRALSPATRDD